MMMTPSYFTSGEFDPFHQANHRVLPNHHSHYERSIPYDYYEGHRGSYHEHGGRSVTRTMIHQPQNSSDSAQDRKRISVACSRCRRRKIKCSGELKDGPGCQACRASGADVSQCSFIRVGSKKLAVAGVDIVHPIHRDGSGTSYSSSYPDASSAPTYNQALYHRPSIPTLQTRSAYPTGYDSEYENSPVDGYTYATGRQDSFTGTYGSAENYRSWSTNLPVSTPVSSGAYYEPQYSYSYSNANMQSPAYSQAHNARLPSVTADNFSSLNNMSSLHSSLPAQTAQDRRLPAPYTPQYQTQPAYSAAELPVIPPISAPRQHSNGVHSRNAIPWTTAETNPTLTRRTSRNNLAALGGIMTPTSQQQQQQQQQQHQSAPSMTDSSFGYQFPGQTQTMMTAPNHHHQQQQPPSPNSPTTTNTTTLPYTTSSSLSTSYPTNTTSGSEPFTPNPMRPLHRTTINHPTSGPNLQPSPLTNDEHPVSSHDGAAGLYSFSTETSHPHLHPEDGRVGRRVSQRESRIKEVGSMEELRRVGSQGFEVQGQRGQQGEKGLWMGVEGGGRYQG